MEQNIYLTNLKIRNSDLYIYFMRGLDILARLNEKMHEAYFVGGVVRDFLLNVDFSDIDIATSATPEQIKALYPDADMRFASAGCVTIKEGPMVFELTTFRTEEYERSRKLKAVHYSQKLSDDVLRRDYTVNALALPHSLEVIDFLGGFKDLQTKVIRIIGKGPRRYREDPLRVLRGLELVARYNFHLSIKTKLAIMKSRKEIEHISTLHLSKSLNKIMEAPYKMKALRNLNTLKVFKHLPAYHAWMKQIASHGQNLTTLEIFTLLFLNNQNQIPINTCFEHDFLKDAKELMELCNALSISQATPVMVYNFGYQKMLSADKLNSLYISKYKKQKKNIKKIDKKLPIKKRSELMFTNSELMELLGSEKISRLSEIMDALINKVVLGQIYNSREAIRQEAIRMIAEEAPIKETTSPIDTPITETPVVDLTEEMSEDEEITTSTFTELTLEEQQLVHEFENDTTQLYNIYLKGIEEYDSLSLDEQLVIQENTKKRAQQMIISSNKKYQKLHERGII